MYKFCTTHTISKFTKTELFIFRIILFQYKTCTLLASVQNLFSSCYELVKFLYKVCTVSVSYNVQVYKQQSTMEENDRQQGMTFSSWEWDNYYIRSGGICTISYMLHLHDTKMEPSPFIHLYQHSHKSFGFTLRDIFTKSYVESHTYNKHRCSHAKIYTVI